MIWSADTGNGERVLFLLEFQGTVDLLMALRTTTYTALTLEAIAAGPDFRPGDPLPEFVYLVLNHGDGPWTAPSEGIRAWMDSWARRWIRFPAPKISTG